MKLRTQTWISLLVLTGGLAGLASLASLVGCSRTSPLGSHVGPTITPSPTAPYGLVIDDFEHPAWGKGITDPTNTGNYIDYYGGSELTDYGPKQTPWATPQVGIPYQPASINPYPNLVVQPGGSNLLGGTPGNCMHIYGFSGWNDNTIFQPLAYPYAESEILFGQSINADSCSPHKSFSFSYKLPTGVAPLNVSSDKANFYYFLCFVSPAIIDYAYWGVCLDDANKMVVDGGWHRVTVDFPDNPTFGTDGNLKMTGPLFETVPKQLWAVAKQSIVGFLVEPKNNRNGTTAIGGHSGFNYDISVDDITFN
jgi:hypothetical protein